GSTGGTTLTSPIVGMASSPTGKGYWLVAADGGIFAYGDAPFYGSTGGMTLKSAIVGIAPAKAGRGYWLMAGDGGIFAFGQAPFAGSLPGTGLCKWPQGRRLVASATGGGYWIVGDDGSAWAFGDAQSFGGLTSVNVVPNAPIVGLAPAGSTPEVPSPPVNCGSARDVRRLCRT